MKYTSRASLADAAWPSLVVELEDGALHLRVADFVVAKLRKTHPTWQEDYAAMLGKLYARRLPPKSELQDFLDCIAGWLNQPIFDAFRADAVVGIQSASETFKRAVENADSDIDTIYEWLLSERAQRSPLRLRGA